MPQSPIKRLPPLAGVRDLPLFLIIALPAVIIGLYADSGRLATRYDRSAIAGGEFWRLLSGHWAHLGLSHLLLNLAGWLLVWMLFSHTFKLYQWLIVVVVGVVTMDVGFYYFDPQLSWYVGLSGLLHTLAVAAVVKGVIERDIESLIVAVVIAIKLGYEQIVGPIPLTEESSGGPVVVNAHLYGAIGGAAAALAIVAINKILSRP